MEDQRGTEINFELPDFLKDKENLQQNKLRKVNLSPSNNILENSRFYDSELTEKIIIPPIATTRTLKTEIDKSYIESSLIDSNQLEKSDPPPLPPKPKVVPIKPSNWSNHNLFKMPKEVPQKNDRVKHKLYLEQPTSSFV